MVMVPLLQLSVISTAMASPTNSTFKVRMLAFNLKLVEIGEKPERRLRMLLDDYGIWMGLLCRSMKCFCVLYNTLESCNPTD